MSLRHLFPGGRASLALLALLTLSMACRGEGPGGDPSLVLQLGISPTPPAVGPARLIITLEDTAGTGIADALIVVEGNMTHAGMLPVVDTARMQSPGHYSVPDFGFTMAGDWILTLDATLPDGRRTSLQKASGVVSAVTPGGGRSR